MNAINHRCYKIILFSGILLFTYILTIWMLSPFSWELSHTTIAFGDAFHLAWEVRSIQDAILNPSISLFHASSNYPYSRALTMNPPLYTSAVLGLPFYLLGWSPIHTYNMLIVLGFLGSLWGMGLIGWELSGSPAAGLISGILYTFSSVRFAHIVHLNLLSGYWSLFVIWLALRWQTKPHPCLRGFIVRTLLLALMVAAQVLNDSYNAIFLATALGLLAIYWIGAYPWSTVKLSLLQLGLAGGLALLACLPILVPTLHAWSDLGLQRSFADHDTWSARLENYLVTSYHSPLNYRLDRFHHHSATSGGAEHTLWPGLVTLVLASLGSLASWRTDRQRKGYLLVLLITGLILSLGPIWHLGEHSSGLTMPWYRWFYDHIPFFATVRVPSRWALLVQMGLSGLAAFGGRTFMRLALMNCHQRQATQEWLRVTLCLLLVGVSIVDVWPGHIQGRVAIVAEPLPSVYEELKTLPPGAILEWPMENSDEELNHRYEYYSLFHGHPIVNSASSIVPQRYLDLRDFLRHFPDPTTINLLRDLGVKYININRWELSGWGRLEQELNAATGIRRIGSYDEGRHYLYIVNQEPRTNMRPTATLVQNISGPHLMIRVVIPYWLCDPAEYYTPNRNIQVQFQNGEKEVIIQTINVPPVLFPGVYQWPIADTVRDIDTIYLDGVQLPLASVSGRSRAESLQSRPDGGVLHARVGQR